MKNSAIVLAAFLDRTGSATVSGDSMSFSNLNVSATPGDTYAFLTYNSSGDTILYSEKGYSGGVYLDVSGSSTLRPGLVVGTANGLNDGFSATFVSAVPETQNWILAESASAPSSRFGSISAAKPQAWPPSPRPSDNTRDRSRTACGIDSCERLGTFNRFSLSA